MLKNRIDNIVNNILQQIIDKTQYKPAISEVYDFDSSVSTGTANWFIFSYIQLLCNNKFVTIQYLGRNMLNVYLFYF